MSGSDEAASLVRRLQAGTAVGYALSLGAPALALPEKLTEIQTKVAQGGISATEIKRHLMYEWAAWSFRVPQCIHTAASGRGDKMYCFRYDAESAFFAGLFRHISDAHTQPNSPLASQVLLHERDLYHAHLHYLDHAGVRDLALIFHAKEVPQGLPGVEGTLISPTKHAGDARLMPPDLAKKQQAMHVSTWGTPEFLARNFLWLLSKNEVWLLNSKTNLGRSSYFRPTDAGFLKLLDPDDMVGMVGPEFIAGRIVAQESFGDVITDLNFFPDYLLGAGAPARPATKGFGSVPSTPEVPAQVHARDDVVKLWGKGGAAL